METSEHKQQDEMRVNAPATDADIHSTLDVKSKQEVTEFVDEVPQQKVERKDEKGVASAMNPIIDQTLLDILQRPRIIFSVKWKPTHAVGSWLGRLVLPDELFKASTVWSKLQQYVFLHAGLKFMFRINGTAYHYGTVAAIWRPIALGKTCIPSSDKLSSYDSLYSLIQYPHALLSPSSSQNVEMEVPYQCPVDKIPIKAFSVGNGKMREWANLGVLDILVLNALRAGPRSADTPEVTLDVYASFTNPSLFGYTHQQFSFSSVTYPTPTRHVMPTALRFPIQVTQAGPALTNDDKVTAAQMPIVNIPAKIQASDYNQPSLHLALSKKKFVPPLDSVNLSEHLSHWCLFHQFECTTTTAVNSVLAAYRVMPQNCGVSTVYRDLGKMFFNTKISFISSLFRFWRGPIEYRFDFIASKFHSCRVKIAWYPPGTDKKASNHDLGDTWTKVVDVQGDISVTFTVPFIEPVAYLPYEPASKQFSNGIIVISLLNSLAYPVPNGPPIQCNVWVRAPELELSGFVQTKMPPRGILSPEAQPGYDPYQPWPGVPGTYANATASNTTLVATTVKTPKKQVAQAGPLLPNPFDSENLDRLHHKPTPFVVIPPDYLLDCALGCPYQVKNDSFLPELGCPYTALSLLDYLLMIHIGYKGSMRFVATDPKSELYVAPDSRTLNRTIVLFDESKFPDIMYQRCMTASLYYPSEATSLKDFSVPMYTSLSFRPYIFNKISDSDSPIRVPGLQVRVLGTVGTPVFISAAEDFSFVGLGACPFTVMWPLENDPARSDSPVASPQSPEVSESPSSTTLKEQ